jgi:phosphoribosylanthranilate isomerase
LTSVEDASIVNQAGADYIGIVLFYEKSKRNCTIEKAKEIIQNLDPSIRKVAVTVSPNIDQVNEIEDIGFDILQVHGDLNKDVQYSTTLKIFRAFNEECNKEEMEELVKDDKVIGFVFDGKVPGSGKTFDWSKIKQFNYKDKLLVLAGGLNSNNVQEAIQQINPDIVDVSSSVEIEDKVGKDRKKVKQFIDTIKIR